MKNYLKICLFFLTVICPLVVSSYQYEFVVASMFHNEAEYLKEWVEYHRMVGAEHFWLYNDRSSDNWEEVLQPYIQEGLIEVFDWPTKSDYTSTQVLAFKNALQKGNGITKWLAFVDLDEFILPMKEATVPQCLNKHFSTAHAVYVNWRCFGSGGIYVPKGKPLLFYLTACSLKHHSRNCVGKTFVRPDFADIDSLWYIHTCPLKQNGHYLNGDGNPLPPITGINIETDGHTHTNLIRINHYVMKDENYFQNVRVARAINGYNGYRLADVDLIKRQNEEFSLIKDAVIINFIKKYYPEMHEKIWKE